MKVTIARQTGILTLPPDAVIFQELTKDGRYHYRVKYNVNALKAIRNKTHFVKISVSTAAPDTKNTASSFATNGEEVAQSLLRQTTNKIEAGRAFVKGLVTTITSDITSRFPNDQTKSIANLKQGDALFKRTQHKLVKASELTKQNISQPIHQIPLHQPTVNEISLGISPTTLANTLLLKTGIDPAVVGQRTNLFLDTHKAKDGTSQTLGGIAKLATSTALDGHSRAALGILAAVTKSNSRPSDQLGLTNDELVVVPYTEETNDLVIEEDLFIDSSTIGDQFYILFQLHNGTGLEMETLSTLVQHSRNVAIASLPIIPPFISASPCVGYNRLELKQIDKNGAGVIIYRKVVDLQTVTLDNGFVQVAKIPIRQSDGSRWYEDRFTSLKPVVYRVIAYNRDEFKSSEFSSATCTPLNKFFSVRSRAEHRKSFLSLHAKIVGKSIQLEMNDIPPLVLALKVYRRDLTLAQSVEDAQQIGNLILMPELPTSDMRFYVTDDTLVDRRDYEYLVKLIYKDGIEIWATPPVQIRYNPVTNGILTTTSSPMKVVNIGLEQDIQFTLTTTVTEGKIDQVQKAMARQGILGFFQDDIVNNREYLQSLIAYHIKRVNLTTGDIENMGIFMGSDFSDRTHGARKGIKPVKTGCEYEYEITTYFRNSQTLLATFQLLVEDTTNPDRTYSYAPMKWQNPITLREGNVVSPESLQRNHSTSEFSASTVGAVTHLRLSLAESTPLIQNASANPIGIGKVLVQWELKGSSKEIDHFLITSEELGMITMVGKAHALSDSKSIQFIDSFEEKHVDKRGYYEGAVSYTITPVLFDYSMGVAAKTQQLIVKKPR